MPQAVPFLLHPLLLFLSDMKKTIEYIIIGFIATILWEFGHPFIPGLVVDHDHTHECVSTN